MSHKKDAEPPKLMPLEEFKKFVQAIARVPKEQIDKIEAENKSDRKAKWLRS